MSHKAFIETQFPISKLSKESYKERKAVQSQTLTGLGKWWGRKPLVLVRSSIIGLLMPATDDPRKDREIFLKVLTMDNDGLWCRKTSPISLKDIYIRATPRERKEWFDPESSEKKPKYKKDIKADQREIIQKAIFMRMSYDDKLVYCERPEQIDGPTEKAWSEINAYLGTNAHTIAELIQELGIKRFGHIPLVGDAFCGGGSIPFEAARIGCEAYGSDLNPVGTLLTWASLNIVGGGSEVAAQVQEDQNKIYGFVDKQIIDWGIEHNEKGWRADAYLYCNEAVCPECGWKVPLLSTFLIGPTSRCIAVLKADMKNRRFNIDVKSDVSKDEIEDAKINSTLSDSYLVCPNSDCLQKTPISMLRGDRGGDYGLRMWENSDFIPRPDDVFQERLYCIRWVETYFDDKGNPHTRRHFRAPDANDLKRELEVIDLLKEHFTEWQEKGYIPGRKIEPGTKTDEPIRTRGWTHWHHLFTPRQLLTHGLLLQKTFSLDCSLFGKVASVLGVGRCANWDSRLCQWGVGAARESIAQTFYNQALNAFFNYAGKGLSLLSGVYFINFPETILSAQSETAPKDARLISNNVDVWITDPPYADAINYHELTEFFLAWYEKHILTLFPGWYADSKRALAVVGSDENFRKSMVDCYRNLVAHMPDDGMQVVMFTHQDASVWADLALILWASGLRVTAAWCIATETDSALKEGNYVQGTVLLVLRKQTSEETAFLDEIYSQIETEVETQLKSMLALEDDEDPNFGDADYQLAAYAAALRVLTQYKKIEEIDVAYELAKPRKRGEVSPIEHVIANAVKAACDYLVPKGFDTFIWKTLAPEERLYLKGLEIESHGEFRTGVYQELARGFGIKEYKPLLESGKANQTRIKTATEFSTKELGSAGFGSSLVRNALFAIREVVKTEEVQQGKNWLKNEVKDYWNQRTNIIEILRYLSTMGYKIDHWKKDAEAAGLLGGAVQNDHI